MAKKEKLAEPSFFFFFCASFRVSRSKVRRRLSPGMLDGIKSLPLIKIKCWRWRYRRSCRIPMDLALDINILENFHPAKIAEQQQRSLELLLQTQREHRGIASCLNITAEAFTQHSFIFKQLIASWLSPFFSRSNVRIRSHFLSLSSTKARRETVSGGFKRDTDGDTVIFSPNSCEELWKISEG